MPVRISTLLDPARILLQVRQQKRTAAIHEVARLLDGHPDIDNFPAFYNELLTRERLDPTYIGNETALPHARTEHASRIVVAAGRSGEGIHFENCGQNVRFVFVIATPKTQPTEYLTLVGGLCRLMKDPGLRDALAAAASPAEFIDAFTQAEDRLQAGT